MEQKDNKIFEIFDEAQSFFGVQNKLLQFKLNENSEVLEFYAKSFTTDHIEMLFNVIETTLNYKISKFYVISYDAETGAICLSIPYSRFSEILTAQI
jgi:hypothetical protein